MTAAPDLLQSMSQVADGFRVGLRELYFPEDGAWSRHGYPKSLEFFRATGEGAYKVFSIFGGNRTSKTFSPCYAIACWVMGEYPEWWDGLRFTKPVRVWAAGETGTLVRNSIQRYLIGTKEALGIGSLIPASAIKAHSWQAKPQGLCERVAIEGRYGTSMIEFKSYDQGRQRFASDAIDVVLLDEEAPAGIFTECLTRTATTRGIVINAFTALKGVTPLVAMLLPQFAGGEDMDEVMSLEVARWHCFVGWDDVPEAQLPAQERKRLAASYLPSELMARTKGIPTIGSGMVWPISESDILVPAFTPPEDWPRLVTLDPGFEHGTGALLIALDQEADAVYVVADHWKRLEHLSVHAAKIASWGEWIPVAMDYASGQNIEDGEAVKSKYRKALKNPVVNANKAWARGAGEVYDRMTDGRFFVMDSCRLWIEQFRQYVRNEKGKIAMPTNAHDPKFHHFELMDCSRYACMGVQHAKVMPPEERQKRRVHRPVETVDRGQSVDMMRGFF